MTDRVYCTERVYHRDIRTASGFRCGKYAKYDPDENGQPTKCGTHCKAAVERRERKQQEQWDREHQKMMDRAKANRENAPLAAKGLRGLSDEHFQALRALDQFSLAIAINDEALRRKESKS